MTRPLLADHHCNTPRTCVAKRCTNGCGQYEHVRPHDLPEGCLSHDLTISYVEGGWCGPGLIIQVRAALGRPSAARHDNSEGGTRNKPGSKPPGWNADASALLTAIPSADRDLMADWRRQARTILGFSVPSIELPGVSCFACGKASLRVAKDAQSDVWCANTDGCHDDERYPYCTDDHYGYPRTLGYGRPACRPTEKSLTHAVRFPQDSWAPIWQQMQKDAELEQAS
jgi:hypothetical protein